MRWQKALDQVVSKLRGSRTVLARKAYQVSASKKLSRLYGFRNVGPDGHVEQVSEEVAVVQEVVHGFAEGLSAETIKARLDAKGVSNRSGKRFSKGELIGLMRSVFCGYVKGPAGILVRSRVYPPLVSRREWAQAAKNVAGGLKTEDFEPLWDIRNDDDCLLAVE